jgi:guanine deaminase
MLNQKHLNKGVFLSNKWGVLQSSPKISFMKNSLSQTDIFFLQKTIALAKENVLSGKGGPFAAIITKNDEIIATGTNVVTTINDPTAHAEVSAIREACRKLNDFQLEECTLYSSCEPCPMCLGAIYWARLKRLVFAANKHQAEKAGFDDAFIYKEMELPYHQRQLDTIPMALPEDNKPFELWMNSTTKREY